MQLFDTHCHIQSAGLTVGERSTRELWAKAEADITVDSVIKRARAAQVQKMICVGCDLTDSQLAVEVARSHDDIYASIGLHPHEAQHYAGQDAALQAFARLAEDVSVVAIGECGLDFFYTHSPKEDQVAVLEFQLDLARSRNLPVIFHVREAFDLFWPIFDNFSGIRGVLHSFTDSIQNMEKATAKGLSIGVNGIATFAKQSEQLEMYRSIPLENLVLETDAPFLTPVPFRGKVCEPKHIALTAAFLANLRGDTTAEIIQATTRNAEKLFSV